MSNGPFKVVYVNIDLASGLLLLVVSLPLLVPLGVATWLGHVRRQAFFVALVIVLLAAAAIEIVGIVYRQRSRSAGSVPPATSLRWFFAATPTGKSTAANCKSLSSV